MRRIPRYHNPKQRLRGTHPPHASTTVTYHILEVLPLCLNLNESKICRTGDIVYIFLYIYAGLCWNSATRHPEGALFDAPIKGNFLPKPFAAGLGKIDCTQMYSFSISLEHNAILGKRIL